MFFVGRDVGSVRDGCVSFLLPPIELNPFRKWTFSIRPLSLLAYRQSIFFIFFCSEKQ